MRVCDLGLKWKTGRRVRFGRAGRGAWEWALERRRGRTRLDAMIVCLRYWVRRLGAMDERRGVSFVNYVIGETSLFGGRKFAHY